MKGDFPKFWTAYYTKPRNEKKVAERLASKGFDVYCPTRTVVKQWSDRKKKVKEAIFKSYIFACVDEISRIEVLMDSGVVSNVTWLGRPAVIRDSEIEQIRAFLDQHPGAELCQNKLATGDEIMIDYGPLHGQKGVISRIQGSTAYLLIESLGVELSARVGIAHLKKFD